VLIKQIGFRESTVDRILKFIVDEILSTNDLIEEGSSINSMLASKLNAMLSVIFTCKQDEILFGQLESGQRRQIVDAATSKFKLAFS